MFASLAAAQGVQWQPDLESAKQAAAASNRLVLMHFSASWCHWCKPLEKNVFAQPEVARAVEASYVAVRMDYDQHRQIAKQYGVKGVPWDVVITPDGSWVEDFNSPQTAEMYSARVTKIAGREAAKMNALYANQQPPAGPSSSSPPIADSMPPAHANPPTQGLASGTAPVDTRQPALPAAARKPSNDRYADYFANRQPAAPRQDALNPAYANQAVPSATSPGAAWPNHEVASASPPNFGQGAAQTPFNSAAPALNGPINQPGGSAGPALSSPGAGFVMPPASAPVARSKFALEGYCPVHLSETETWVPGDEKWGAVHRGKTYLFISEACRDKFMKNPDHYAPALSGNDPVALVDRGQTVEGRRQHGCFFGEKTNRRVVLFANEASFETFQQNRQRYAGQIFAPQP
jgi:YHS domain-containing protein/thiol-disulfide isomerase/thioredoxin